MNILYLTKSKKYTCMAVRELAQKHHIVGVVCKKIGMVEGTELEQICREGHIRLIENDEMYEMLSQNKLPKIDLAISNTYGRLIRQPLLEWVKGNCINLHGAVLPEYKGLYTYNHGLLNDEKEWGATAHYVNERFDEGNIIETEKFPICADEISVMELEEKTQEAAYRLTLKLVAEWEKRGPLPGIPQQQRGTYYSKEDFERAKEIFITDSAETVSRKIHAFWCPPYEGAYITIEGNRFQLMTSREQE